MPYQKSPKFDDNPLHKMLVEKLPPRLLIDGRLDIRTTSKECGCAAASIYRMMDTGRMSRRSAKAFIDLSEGKLTKEDLIPYLLGI
jgi:hypothetical protein